MEASEHYFSDIIKSILTRTLHCERIIKKQLFSLEMTENLINDLLDLAKIDNHSFKFDLEYFNLASTIY